MRHLLPALLLCLPAVARPQVPASADWQFAMSLSSSTDGQLFCLFLVKVKDGQVTESRPITRENFIRQAQGRAFSLANPDAEDLFRDHGVQHCTLPLDSAALGFLTDCSTLNDLWKLRYWEYPLKTDNGQHTAKGWSAKPLSPGSQQLEILKGYGMRFLNDLIVGEQFFRLLHDMGEPRWVTAYRNAA
jgi:hypothetical protein